MVLFPNIADFVSASVVAIVSATVADFLVVFAADDVVSIAIS